MRASDHRCPRSSLIFIVPEASRSEGIPISGDHLHETVERNTMFFLNDQTFLQHFPQRSADQFRRDIVPPCYRIHRAVERRDDFWVGGNIIQIPHDHPAILKRRMLAGRQLHTVGSNSLQLFADTPADTIHDNPLFQAL